MKQLFVLSTLLFLGFSGKSQTTAPPQGINYQAVAIDLDDEEIVGMDEDEEDDNGDPLSNHTIRVRFSIIKDNPSGTLAYRESHTTITDEGGLFNLVIGQGAQDASPGSFDQIDWGTGFHFLKVEMDVNGGFQYIDMGTQQMWSVPYALYSKTAGNGISSVTDNGDGTLTFTYIDGSSYTTGVLNGLTGPQGSPGQNGQSAYEIWLSQGNTGTLNDFLTAMQGPTGPAGANGAAGQSAYQIWLSQGNTGTISDYLNSLQGTAGVQGPVGPQGATGAQGAAGQSAYQIWLSQGNTGTIGDFLNSLQGPVGVQGPSGTNGAAGQSAYQIWLSQGNIGTTSDFLNSLQGPAGTPGSLNAWSLTGNSGTNPLSNFIGTVDAQDWVIKTSNTERMRLTSNGRLGLGTSAPQSDFEVVGLSKFGSGGQATIDISWDNGTLMSPLLSLNTSSGGLIKAPYQGNLIMQIRGNHWDDGLMVVTDKNLDGTPDAVPFKVLSNGWVGIGKGLPSQIFHINNDNSGSDSSVVVTNEGKVGIGTSTPSTKLDVIGTVKITDGTEGAGKILTSDASGNASWQTATASSSGIYSTMSVYANAGTYTFTVPANVTKIMVEVWGGGGGGGNNSTITSGYTSGGGGGGYGKEIFTVTPGTTYTITVGAGGAGGTNNGGSSSFGTLISATGGLGGMSIGNAVIFATGGTSTAVFNIKGQTGQFAGTLGGMGGDSFGGSGGRGAANGAVAEAGIAPGGGGGGGMFQIAGYTNGAAGAQGRVVVHY